MIHAEQTTFTKQNWVRTMTDKELEHSERLLDQLVPLDTVFRIIARKRAE